MIDSTQIAFALFAGALASFAYFGGLWLTVKKLSQAANPLGVYLTSFVVRVSVLMYGALLLLRVGWQCVLPALVGFLLVRYLMTLSLGLSKSGLDAVRGGHS